MLRSVIIGAAAAATLTAATLTPALAMIPQCMETPNAETCPYAGAPTKAETPPPPVHKPIHHARNELRQPTRRG